MANSQMVIPHKTQSYGDVQDAPQDAVPMCTLKSFPFMVEHCIEWAREKFGVTFTKALEETIKFIEDPADFMKEMKNTRENQIESVVETSYKVMILKKDFAACMQVAREMFDSDYDFAIRDLVGTFPEDAEKDGQKFWQGSKKFPTAIAFDADNDMVFQYMNCMANLLAANLGMEPNRDENEMRNLAKATKS